MTVKELKHELSAQHILTVGLKIVLVIQLITLLENEDVEVINDDMDDANNVQEENNIE